MSHRFGEVIASPANPLIKQIRSLQRRRTRHQERAFLVEGFRAVDEALQAGADLRAVLVREDVPLGELDPRLRAMPTLRRASTAVFQAASTVEAPQGILAVVGMPEQPALATWQDRVSLALVIDNVRDPGNLGTLLRSAAGAGADFALLSEGSVDPYNPKVVRAAMGAHFRLPVYQAAGEPYDALLASVAQVVIGDAAGEVDYDLVDYRRPTAVVVGGEAFGPLGHVDHPGLMTARVPLMRQVESLNAGVAGSLLLFEAARQRRRMVGGPGAPGRGGR